MASGSIPAVAPTPPDQTEDPPAGAPDGPAPREEASSSAAAQAQSATGSWMSGRVAVPPWVQLVGLPLLVIFGVMFAMAASRAVIIFMIAGLIALLLNPVVRRSVRWGVPRAIAVFVVFGLFSVVITVLSIVAVNILVQRVEAVQQDLPSYYAQLDDRIDTTQRLLDERGVSFDLRAQGDHFVEGLQDRSSELTGDVLDFGQEFVRTAAEAILSVIAVIVITIYMLLDAPRIGRVVSSMFPRKTGIHRLFPRLERALFNYVRGQTLTSLVMGASAALGIWLLAVVGLWEGGQNLAAIFGLIVALTQFAPSIGPVIGSIPPLIVAALDGVVPVVSVLVLFLLLHQIEGHIVVPKLMGAAIAVHPLLVIFGILAGAQILGAGGILLALPLLAVARELAWFIAERFELGTWPGGVSIPVAARAGGGTAVAGTGAGAGPTGGAAPRDSAQ